MANKKNKLYLLSVLIFIISCISVFATQLSALDSTIAPDIFQDTVTDYGYYLIEDFENINLDNVTGVRDTPNVGTIGGPNITTNNVEKNYALNFSIITNGSTYDEGGVQINYYPPLNLLNYDSFALWVYIEDINAINCSFDLADGGPFRIRLSTGSTFSAAQSVTFRASCDDVINGWNLLKFDNNRGYGDFTSLEEVNTIKFDMNTNNFSNEKSEIRIDKWYGYKQNKWYDNYTGYNEKIFSDVNSAHLWDISADGDVVNITQANANGIFYYYDKAINISWEVNNDTSDNFSQWDWNYRDIKFSPIDISRYDKLEMLVYINDINSCGSNNNVEGFHAFLYSNWSTVERSVWNKTCSELQNGWNTITWDLDTPGTTGVGGPANLTKLHALRFRYYNNNLTDDWILLGRIRAYDSNYYYNMTPYIDQFPGNARGEWTVTKEEYYDNGTLSSNYWLNHIKTFSSTQSILTPVLNKTAYLPYEKSYELITRIKMGNVTGGFSADCGITTGATTRNALLFGNTQIRISPEEGTAANVIYNIPNPAGSVRWARLVVDNGQLMFYYKNETTDNWVLLYSRADARISTRYPGLLPDEANCFYDNIRFRELPDKEVLPHIDGFLVTDFDQYRNYDFVSTDSLETITDILTNHDCTNLQTTLNNIDRDYAVQCYGNISLSLENDSVLKKTGYGHNYSYYDKFTFWFYINDSSQIASHPNPAISEAVRMILWTNESSNVGSDWWFNASYFHDGWNYIVLDMDNPSNARGGGPFDKTYFEGWNLGVWNSNTNDYIIAIDGIQVLKTSEYLDKWWEYLNNEDNKGGVNIVVTNQSDKYSGITGALNIVDNDGSFYTTLAYNNRTYENFEIIFKGATLNDYGTNLCLFSLTENEATPYGNNTLIWGQTSVNIIDDEGNSYLNSDVVANGVYNHYKVKYNNTWIEWYFSNDSQETWQLFANYTVDAMPVSRLKLAAYQSQCIFDNLVIRDINPYNYSTTKLYSPSYTHSPVWDGTTDIQRENVTYELYKNSILEYTDVINNPTDFSQINYRTLDEGIWQANITTCYYNTDIPCVEVQSEAVSISLYEIPVVPPGIEIVNITPDYPYTHNNLTGLCLDLNDTGTYNYTLEWYNSSTLFSSTNFTGNFSLGLYSVLTSNYTNVDDIWTVRCRNFDGLNWSDWNNASVRIHNESITLLAPANDTFSNDPINATFIITDYIDLINCSLNVNSSVVTNDSTINNTITALLYNPPTDGVYVWNITCYNPNDNLSLGLQTETRTYTFDGIGPTYDNYADSSNALFPQVNDTIELYVRVYDLFGVDTCKLQIQDNGSYWNYSTTTVGAAGYTNLTFNYTVRDEAAGNGTQVNWTVWCNDSASNIGISAEQNFTVKDLIEPQINLLSGNFFNSNNRTILSSYLYPTNQLNVQFADISLFQAAVNITCEDNGTIYYWEQLDFNVSIYNLTDNVNIAGMNPQKCTAVIQASDDHTKNKIKDYKETKLDDGLEFETENEILINIKDKDGATKIKSVDTKKLTDRYTFEFKLKNKEYSKTFIISSDSKIYDRPNSEYPGHLVTWNEETMSGNWIDFKDKKANSDLVYTTTKIDDYTYEVSITSVNGFDELQFESIGGTNINTNIYEFYIGGVVNATTYNISSGTTFTDWSLDVKTINSYPGSNQSIFSSNSSYIVANLSNGTYNFSFTHPSFVSQSYLVTVENQTQTVTYTGYQAVVHIIPRNIKTLVSLPNANVTIGSPTTIQQNVVNNDNVTVSSDFFVDAGTYWVYIDIENYDSVNTTFSINNGQEKTVYVDMPFIATFLFFDERTLEPFNISSADSVRFLLFCPESTFTTIINATTQAIPIDCNYDKFKLILDYGVTSYYRTFIFPPEEGFNQSIYLIDLTTTQYIFSSLIIDDLYNSYDNPSIYVKKTIGNETIIITADFIDIENKIGAYLIENEEYIIEVHSDNNPIRVMGIYSATVGGDKNLRLYDINLDLVPNSFVSTVTYQMTTENRTGDLYVVAEYNDTLNQTDSVRFTVYTGEYGGTLVYNSVVLNSPDIEFEFNASVYENVSLYGGFVIEHQDAGTITPAKALYEDNTLAIPLFNHVDKDFMDWLITVLLAVIAIMATIRTANYMSMIVLGFAALMITLGWFRLAWGIIGLGAIIALLSLLKKGDKNMSDAV